MVSLERMKIRALSIFFTAVLGAVGTTLGAYAHEHEVGGEIVGETLYCTQDPFTSCQEGQAELLERILVEARRNGRRVAATQTDENGRFSLKLSPGRYSVRALGESKRIRVRSKPLRNIKIVIPGF